MNKISINGVLTKKDAVYNQNQAYSLSVERKSGTVDTLLVLSPDAGLLEGPVHIEGKLHAEYIHGIGVPAAIIPDTVVPGEADGSSEAEITGILKEKPKCRTTKSGLGVASIRIVTEEGTIPVLLWGGNAANAEKLFDAGDLVGAAGRLQSREYPDRQKVVHTTYELSARGLERMDGENNQA